MPPIVALTVCLLFILCCLYVVDNERRNNISWAIWIPIIWMCILGSRNISLFFYPTNVFLKPEDYLEGSPIDRVLFGILMLIGIIVLLNRDISWTNLLVLNKNKVGE